MSKHSERWESNAEAFGANLKHIRERNNMSGAQLANITGISRTYLFELENRPKSAPSVFIAYGLAIALGTTIEELIGLPASIDSVRAASSQVAAAEATALRRKLERIVNICKEPNA